MAPKLATIGFAALLTLSVRPHSILITLQSSGSQSSPDENNLCAVAGQVVRDDTNEPLRKARVVLSNEDDNALNPYVAFTDGAGKFSLVSIRPGRYRVVAARDGYLPSSSGENASSAPSILALNAGQQVTGLVFRLQRYAAIAGRVADADGDIAEGVTVEAVASHNFRGRQITVAEGAAQTDDRGEYRIFHLAPGRYYLRATPQNRSFRTFGSVELPTSTLASFGGYVPTFYPNGTDVARASQLEVKAGDDIEGMDIELERLRTYTVRGRVLNTADEVPTRLAIVDLVPEDSGAEFYDAMRPFVVTNESTGAFEVHDVPPGSYSAVANYNDSENQLMGSAPVQVVDADVDSIRIVIARGAELHGRIIREGAVPTKDVVLLLESVELRNLTTSKRIDVKTDGAFSTTGLQDGTYDLVVRSRCDACFIKSATAGGQDVLKQGLRVTSWTAPSPLEVVYSANSGTVDGVVSTDNGRSASNATVVLLPDPYRPTAWHDYLEESTDQFGHFICKGVAPGKYRAYAWQKFDDDLNLDAEFLKQPEQKPTDFSVAENEKKSLQLTVLPGPPRNP